MNVSTTRYIPVAILALSGMTVIVVGVRSHLPTGAVVTVGLLLLALSIVSFKVTIPRRGGRGKFWISITIGLMLFLDGSVGLVRSFQEPVTWLARLPLLIPVGLGSCTIWYIVKFRRKFLQ